VFLVSLSDAAAGGNGDHGAFKAALGSIWFTHAAAGRQGDAIAGELLDGLAGEYASALRAGPQGLWRFFNMPQVGLMRFHVRYLHYVLLGLDPHDEQATLLFTEAFYATGGPITYMSLGGWELLRGPLQRGDLGGVREAVVDRYMTAPAMQAFREGRDEFHHLTRRELARLMVSIMCVAALQGPLHLARTAMGGQSLPEYRSAYAAGLVPPSAVDVPSHWDALDLEDDDSVELHILELARLFAPVSTSHHVAREPFTAWVAGRERTFPAGTLVSIPIGLASLDAALWGHTRYEFNPRREGLRGNSMAFNSVGNRSAGRMCPGRGVAVTMLADMLRVVGAARRLTLTARAAA